MKDQRSSTIQPVPAVRDVSSYNVPEHPAPQHLDLSGNQGITPPDELMEALSSISPETIRSYPSTEKLRTTVANHLGTDPERIIITAGAEDALFTALRTLLGPDRNAVTTEPGFVMIPRFVRLTGASLKRVPWLEGSFPIEDVYTAADQHTSVVLVDSPNNPTGLTASPDTIIELSDRFPDTLILLDHSYIEFADGTYDVTRDVLSRSNMMVIRTFSKALGLAGLRVGYAVGPPEVIDWMQTARRPYAVSGISLKLARKRLELDRNDVNDYVERVRKERNALQSMLSSYNCQVAPSQANFVLANFDNAQWVFDALAGMGISTRRFPDDNSLQHHLRITCPGNEDQFHELTRAIETIFEPEAILFDMDGVLADVSGSYRRAIQETASSFGVNVTMDEIAEAKMEGDANNDWVLTKRLIEQNDGSVTLDEVRERFETLYQGTENRPGLYRNEELLVDSTFLKSISERYATGIVTGRPTPDAERFLQLHDIDEHFDCLIGMDDVEHVKPDPEPVRKAMQRLSVRRAWLIGDTPDDIQAGRDASVLTIGVVPPGEDRSTVEEKLKTTGAARVLSDTDELSSLIPSR